MTSFDHEFDVVIIGSGAAALATALGAVDEGLSAVMLESSDKWGGNSNKSGGGMWLPNNPLMRRDGAGDSREDALTYLAETAKNEYRATSRERQEAFVDGVDDWVNTCEKHGISFVRAKEYADYYPELPGGKIGRALEIYPISKKKMGPYRKNMAAPAALPVMTDDVWLLTRAFTTVSGFARGVQLVFRTLRGLLTGKGVLAGIGVAFTGSLLNAAVGHGGAKLWMETEMTDLIVEDGKVVGVVANHAGRDLRIGARRGVILGSGGFDGNRAKRKELQGIEGHPSGVLTNMGVPIEAAEKHGAALELMDDAWWGASVISVNPGVEDPSFIVGERAMPYSIIVDDEGHRFANEAESYVDLGHHMLAHKKDGRWWMIAEKRHRRYLRNYLLAPGVKQKLSEQGSYFEADSIEELAEKLDMKPEVLRATVDRFNGFARSGVDGDFGRGNSAYDRYYSDPTVKPNPNLGPLEKPPFDAVEFVIGDLGTKGGVVTDEHARVLREDGSVIEGLYASGNCSASVMGHTYPGPGSTLGPAVVFGLIAARHIAKATKPSSLEKA